MSNPGTFLIVVSGPSGAGKTTIVDKVLALDQRLIRSVSATTRPPRPGEAEGKDYFFVSPGEFEKMKKHDLLEWAQVYECFYGTPKLFVENQLQAGFDVMLNIDVQGAEQVKKVFDDAVMVFILPPSFAVLAKRMELRGAGDSGDLQLRLDNARSEIERARNYDYIVVNDKVDEATEGLLAIINAERQKIGRSLSGFLGDFF